MTKLEKIQRNGFEKEINEQNSVFYVFMESVAKRERIRVQVQGYYAKSM